MAGKVRMCACACGTPLPPSEPLNRKFLNDTHRNRQKARRARRKKRTSTDMLRVDAKPSEPQRMSFPSASDIKADGRPRARRGPQFEAFLETPYPEMIATSRISISKAAQELDTSPANVSRWMASYVQDRQRDLVAETWTRPPEVQEALEDFGAFCRRYWPEDQVLEFHMEWADLIANAMDEGGRVMLLASQRHGKSSLLRKFCAWRICQNPNVRMLWVSQTQDLAEKSVGYILDILTTHEKLKEEILGPGQEFRPPSRSNMSWTREQFTVGNRTKLQASPTMVALGKGGSILSRDADEVIVDDLQEYKHIRSPGQRETDIEWFFTDLMSRKLPATGVAVIGSRQHIQDAYSEIIKRGDEWTIKVYPVHDPACTIDERDHEAHDASGCMLWPEQYPHKFMQEQRRQQGEAYFQRNMMNNPKSDATVLVSASDLERCKDRRRRVGEIPPGSVLIAGIDPADSKPVAGVLWAHERGWVSPNDENRGPVGRRHVVDIMEADAGIRGGRQIMQAWKRLYGCSQFIIESNMAKSWLQDTEVLRIQAELGVQLVPQYTSKSTKWDPGTGVVAMFGRMRTDPPSITFPWGDRESEKKMERLLRTFLMFDPDYVSHKAADDDLPMAAWFPQLTMDMQVRPHGAVAQKSYFSTPYTPSRALYVVSPQEASVA